MTLVGLLIVVLVFFFLYCCIKHMDINAEGKKLVLNVLLIIGALFLILLLVHSTNLGALFNRPIMAP